MLRLQELYLGGWRDRACVGANPGCRYLDKATCIGPRPTHLAFHSGWEGAHLTHRARLNGAVVGGRVETGRRPDTIVRGTGAPDIAMQTGLRGTASCTLASTSPHQFKRGADWSNSELLEGLSFARGCMTERSIPPA